MADYLQKTNINFSFQRPAKNPYLEVFKRKQKKKLNSLRFAPRLTGMNNNFPPKIPNVEFKGAPIIMNNTSFYQYYYIQPETPVPKHSVNTCRNKQNNLPPSIMLPYINHKVSPKRAKSVFRTQSTRPSVSRAPFWNDCDYNLAVPLQNPSVQSVRHALGEGTDVGNFASSVHTLDNRKPNRNHCMEMINDSIVNLPKPEESKKERPKLYINDNIKSFFFFDRKSQPTDESANSGSEVMTPSFLSVHNGENERQKFPLRETVEFDDAPPVFENSVQVAEDKMCEEVAPDTNLESAKVRGLNKFPRPPQRVPFVRRQIIVKTLDNIHKRVRAKSSMKARRKQSGIML